MTTISTIFGPMSREEAGRAWESLTEPFAKRFANQEANRRAWIVLMVAEGYGSWQEVEDELIAQATDQITFEVNYWREQYGELS